MNIIELERSCISYRSFTSASRGIFHNRQIEESNIISIVRIFSYFFIRKSEILEHAVCSFFFLRSVGLCSSRKQFHVYHLDFVDVEKSHGCNFRDAQHTAILSTRLSFCRTRSSTFVRSHRTVVLVTLCSFAGERRRDCPKFMAHKLIRVARAFMTSVLQLVSGPERALRIRAKSLRLSPA